MTPYNTIAEMQHFIVLDSYTKYSELHEPPWAIRPKPLWSTN